MSISSRLGRARAKRKLVRKCIQNAENPINHQIFSEIVGEYGQKPLYRMLGYFSVICLLRVHVLLGDSTLALKVMENVELSQR